MKVITNRELGTPTLVVVCCLHGDELFGKELFNHTARRISHFPGLMLILANEEAIAQRVRFLDTDLNRSFPGTAASPSHEQRLAAQLLRRLVSCPLVVDVHTTTVILDAVAIVTKLGPGERRILNTAPVKEVAIMPSDLAQRSLIGHVQAGVSLEFGRAFAAGSGLPVMSDVLMELTHGVVRPRRGRRIFEIEGVLTPEDQVPRNARNLRKVTGRPIYPFLLGEKAYTEHSGFWARSFRRASI